MKFQDIPQFPHSYYQVNVGVDYLKENLEQWDARDTGSPLIMNPDFQRGHVWSEDQQRGFVEYFLKGGTLGRNIYFNCSSWDGNYSTPVYCVDGLQRITAMIAFLDNELAIFDGNKRKDFDGKLRTIGNTFIFHMLRLRSKRELLRVYLDFNSGGTPHNPDELARVAQLIEDTPEDETL